MKIIKKNNKYIFDFYYRQEIIDFLRDLKSKGFKLRFNGGTRNWEFTDTRVAELLERKLSPSIVLDEAVKNDILKYKKRITSIEERLDNLKFKNGLKLREYQKEAVRKFIQFGERVYNASEIGLGKSCETLATSELMGYERILIITPASLKYNWEAEIRKWLGDEISVQILESKPKNDDKLTAKYIIINYDILDRWLELIKGYQFDLVVYDEVHNCKSYKTKRTKLSKEIAKNIPKKILLSGTPIVNHPQELISQLMIMDKLDDFGGFWNYLTHFCSWNGEFIGEPRNLGELNNLLREKLYFRHERKDVLPELPPVSTQIIPIKIDNNTYLKKYAELKAELKATVPTAMQLVLIEKLKQYCVSEKMAIAKEFIKNVIDNGEKLIIFGTHKAVIQELYNEFADISVVIDGGVDNKIRQERVNQFQNDNKIRLFIGNMLAAGTGLTLTAASKVLFMELGWTPVLHEQAAGRAIRIGQNNPVSIYYIIAKNTIEEKILNLLNNKMDIVRKTAYNIFDKSGNILENASINIFSDLISDLEEV